MDNLPEEFPSVTSQDKLNPFQAAFLKAGVTPPEGVFADTQHLASLLTAVPPDKKGAVAIALIDGAFYSYSKESTEKQEDKEAIGDENPPDLPQNTARILKTALNIDQQTAQARLFRLLREHHETAPGFFERIYSMKEMASPDSTVLYDAEGQYLNYRGIRVSLNPPVLKAASAKEALSGKALILFDHENNPLGIIDPNLPFKPEESDSIATFFEDSGSFAQSVSFGEAVSLNDVSQMLRDKFFQAEFEELTARCPNQNPNDNPLFARARLRRMLQEQTITSEDAKRAFNSTPTMALAVLQNFKDEDVPEMLQRISLLSGYLENDDIEQAARFSLFNTFFAGEFAGRGSPGFDDSLRQLGESKSRRILKEFLMLEKRKDPQTRKHDLKLALKSITRFNDMVRHAWNMSLGLDFNPDLSEYHPRQMLEVLGFAAAHPEAPALAQTLFEWTLICEIALQKKSQYYGRIQELKREFYRRFRENQVMADTAPTGDTPLEIERITKLAAAYLERDDVRKHPGGATLVLLGCDNCLRVENEVIKRLKKEGFSLGRIIGIDIGDVADEIPPDLGVHFIRKDLKDVTLADIFPREKMSRAPVLAVAPWSMICDFFEKEGLLKGLKRISSLVGDNGAVILDVPLPFGDHSYAKALDEQAENFGIWGLMAKGFKTGQDQAVYSLFHIMPPQELLYDLANTGFLPVNVPADLQGLTRLTDEIGLDDSPLARQHTEGSAGNPIEHPFWQTGNGLNRLTVLAERMTEEDILQKAGVAPSLLMKLGFGNA